MQIQKYKSRQLLKPLAIMAMTVAISACDLDDPKPKDPPPEAITEGVVHEEDKVYVKDGVELCDAAANSYMLTGASPIGNLDCVDEFKSNEPITTLKHQGILQRGQYTGGNEDDGGNLELPPESDDEMVTITPAEYENRKEDFEELVYEREGQYPFFENIESPLAKYVYLNYMVNPNYIKLEPAAGVLTLKEVKSRHPNGLVKEQEITSSNIDNKVVKYTLNYDYETLNIDENLTSLWISTTVSEVSVLGGEIESGDLVCDRVTIMMPSGANPVQAEVIQTSTTNGAMQQACSTGQILLQGMSVHLNGDKEISKTDTIDGINHNWESNWPSEERGVQNTVFNMLESAIEYERWYDTNGYFVQEIIHDNGFINVIKESEKILRATGNDAEQYIDIIVSSMGEVIEEYTYSSIGRNELSCGKDSEGYLNINDCTAVDEIEGEDEEDEEEDGAEDEEELEEEDDEQEGDGLEGEVEDEEEEPTPTIQGEVISQEDFDDRKDNFAQSIYEREERYPFYNDIENPLAKYVYLNYMVNPVSESIVQQDGSQITKEVVKRYPNGLMEEVSVVSTSSTGRVVAYTQLLTYDGYEITGIDENIAELNVTAEVAGTVKVFSGSLGLELGDIECEYLSMSLGALNRVIVDSFTTTNINGESFCLPESDKIKSTESKYYYGEIETSKTEVLDGVITNWHTQWSPPDEGLRTTTYQQGAVRVDYERWYDANGYFAQEALLIDGVVILTKESSKTFTTDEFGVNKYITVAVTSDGELIEEYKYSTLGRNEQSCGKDSAGYLSVNDCND